MGKLLTSLRLRLASLTALLSSRETMRQSLSKQREAVVQELENVAELRRVSNSYAAENTKLSSIVAEQTQEIARLGGENEVLRAQMDMYTDWEARERARLQAEADIWRRRSVESVESRAPIRDEFV